MQYPAPPARRHVGATGVLRGTAAVALIASGLLGACSGGDGAKAGTTASEGKPKASASAKDSATGSATGSVGKGGVGARADLQGFSCDAAKSGVWSASGKVVNSTKKSAKYTVDVAVASSKTSTVVGRASKTLTVEPGKTVSFTVPEVANRKGDGLTCTPHVTRLDG